MASTEIRIRYKAVDKAVTLIDEQIQIVNMQKTKIASADIPSAQASTGPCARQLKQLTATELPQALDAVVTMMTNTKQFLMNAKTIWQDTDSGLSK